MQNSKQIQWFPGHMTKAKRQMEENLKKVDFVIEIRDARMPWSSQNPMLESIVQKKPRLIILSKKDKADSILTQQWIDYLQSHENIKVVALNLVKNNYKKDLVQASQELCKAWIEKQKQRGIRIDYLQSHENIKVVALNLVKNNYKKDLVQASQELCKAWIEKQKQRGIRPRALRAMVCGIPNVGKSTMINTLARRKAAQTGDRPGVTKSLQWIRLGQDLELLDTPGVLWPKFENQEIGLRLALLGSIRDRPGVTKSLQWIRLGQDLELLDTPGVLWPKFENQEIGLRLALLGSIRDEVLSLDDLAMFGITWLMEHRPQAIQDTYGIEIQENAYDTLLEIGKKRGYLQKGSVDENRLMKAFVKDLRDNKCGPITWEIPGEENHD